MWSAQGTAGVVKLPLTTDKTGIFGMWDHGHVLPYIYYLVYKMPENSKKKFPITVS